VTADQPMTHVKALKPGGLNRWGYFICWLIAELAEARRQLAEATHPAAGPFALYVDGSCWGDGYETLDLALGDALEAISDRGSIDGVEIRAVAALGVQQ
jgi:hypothetical protein